MADRRIRDLREDRDLRQTDVANATGIDQKTLSNYETGKTNPDMISLIKLADFFGVSIDYLVGRSSLPTNDIPHIASKLEEINRLLAEIIEDIKHS